MSRLAFSTGSPIQEEEGSKGEVNRQEIPLVSAYACFSAIPDLIIPAESWQ
jgi:hypothetical protein